jgi:hypothetical protein
MIRVRTQNSVYEISFLNGEGGLPLGGFIRYVEGEHGPTMLVPKVWRDFHSASMLEVGQRACIVFDPERVGDFITLSPITAIEEI